VSTAAYYAFCLVAGLVVIAIASALIARQLRRREERRLRAAELLDVLARYTEWVAAQGRVLFFPADTQDSTDLALHEIGAIQQEWFPELRREADQLFAVHSRLMVFLMQQRQLRMQDPEAWLESDQDAGYLMLWREHCTAVQALELRLGWFVLSPSSPRQRTSAA
jgi:hypothetical protein